MSSDGWRPEGVESDTVSLLVNKEIMVDTGWHAVHNLLREGVPEDHIVKVELDRISNKRCYSC